MALTREQRETIEKAHAIIDRKAHLPRLLGRLDPTKAAFAKTIIKEHVARGAFEEPAALVKDILRSYEYHWEESKVGKAAAARLSQEARRIGWIPERPREIDIFREDTLKHAAFLLAHGKARNTMDALSRGRREANRRLEETARAGF